MGYMRYHAIIVSSWNDELLAKAHAVALSIFPHVSNIVPHIKNGGGSFFVPPDGSKEGWDASDEGDDRREQFVKWLKEQCYDDFSTSTPWIEVQYADDEKESRILSDSDSFYTGSTIVGRLADDNDEEDEDWTDDKEDED